MKYREEVSCKQIIFAPVLITSRKPLLSITVGPKEKVASVQCAWTWIVLGICLERILKIVHNEYGENQRILVIRTLKWLRAAIHVIGDRLFQNKLMKEYN